jgi:hypothetical protein
MICESHALRLHSCTSHEAKLRDLSTSSQSDQRLISLAFYNHVLALLSSKSLAHQEAIQFPTPFDQANSCLAMVTLDLLTSQVFENLCATILAQHTATTSGCNHLDINAYSTYLPLPLFRSSIPSQNSDYL